MRALKQAAHLLGEHYEAGVVAVTWQEDGKTKEEAMAFGNKHAVQDLVAETLGLCYPETEEEIEA
jgi:hypothetical protein